MFQRNCLLLWLVSSSLCLVQGQVAATKTQSSSPISASPVSTDTLKQTAVPKSAPETEVLTTGDFATSVQNWRTLRAEARKNGFQDAEAEAALKEARTLELWSAVDPSQGDRLPQAIAAYQTVISSGSSSERSVAANNLGVLFLKQGRPAEALQTFQKMDFNSIAPSDSYLYQYNYGRALELNHDPSHAYARYRQAAKLKPDFSPAVEGAYRVLWEMKPPPVEDAADFALVIVRTGRAEFVHDQLKRSLLEWSNQAGSPRLLSALLQSYIVLSLSPPDFQNRELPWLEKIDSVTLKPGIDELRTAFSGHFSYNFGYTPDAFRYWSRPMDREAFGGLLKMIGDYFSDAGSSPEALACYANSWVISRQPEAALYAAAVLRGHRELNPGGRLADQLVESLFEQKGAAYAKQDWPNILRLHTVLATIFEDEARWGSANDPLSAIFQWEHALIAQSQVLRQVPNYPPSPGLHTHLANCYLRVNRVRDAQSQYLLAAEAFVKAGEQEQALSAIRSLRSIGDPNTMTPEESHRVKTIEDVLAHTVKG